ncbi:hypothetical protein [Tistlia consotensis]|nr:hypothetical protein [Tistlia consotensis]
MADHGLEWHSLLDALCVERGYLDNGELASRYCEVTRRTGLSAYESAYKSLANWRQGLHTPTRRNFRILGLLLGVDSLDGERRALWTTLYEQAQRRRPAGEAPQAGAPASTGRPARWPLGRGATVLLAAGLLAVCGVVAGYLTGRSDAPAETGPTASAVPGQIADGPIDMTGQRIYWLQFVRLRPGQSAVVHGKRGARCGAPPPSWDEVLPELPAVASGEWADGGVGYRVSRACQGPTPARAVVFSAHRQGTEMFILYDDPVTIVVD